jgi:transporter family-2 protein
MNVYLAMLFAAGAGVCLALQAASNSRLRQITEQPLWASYFSIIGTISFASLMMLALRPPLPTVESVKSTEWWQWIGGPLGMIVVMAGAFVVPSLGAAKFISLVVAGQLLASLLLDHYGLMGLAASSLTLGKVGGALLIVLGVVCIKFL